MLLTETPDLYVYQLRKRPYFELLGIVEGVKSIAWDVTFSGTSSFKMWVARSKSNYDILKHGNVVSSNGDAFLVQKVEVDRDEDDGVLMCVSGKSIDVLMSQRIVAGIYVANGKYLSEVVHDLFYNNFIVMGADNLLGKYRSFGGMVGGVMESSVTGKYGPTLDFQTSYSNVLDQLDKVTDGTGYGWKLKFSASDKKLRMTLSGVVDKTATSSSPIVLSTDFEDILSSEYSNDYSDLKTIAYVFGEGEGSERKYVTVDLSDKLLGSSLSDTMASEMYVDARDLQSTYKDSSGNEKTMSAERYDSLLLDRGTKKLLENAVSESFSADVRVLGNTQFKLGKDYMLGDKVTVIDKELGVSMDAVLVKVEESISDKYEVKCSFGDSKVSLVDKIVRKLG